MWEHRVSCVCIATNILNEFERRTRTIESHMNYKKETHVIEKSAKCHWKIVIIKLKCEFFLNTFCTKRRAVSRTTYTWFCVKASALRFLFIQYVSMLILLLNALVLIYYGFDDCGSDNAMLYALSRLQS